MYGIIQELADYLDFFLFCTLYVVFTLTTITFATLWFAVAVLSLLVMYMLALNYFCAVSRKTKRLESVSRSPVYATFSETLGGLDMIQAYGCSPSFLVGFLEKLDENTQAYYCHKSADQWLSVGIELIGALLARTAAMLPAHVAILGSAGSTGQRNKFASVASLSLTYTMSVTGLLNWCIRSFVQMEAAMNACEHVLYYTEDIPRKDALMGKQSEDDCIVKKQALTMADSGCSSPSVFSITAHMLKPPKWFAAVSPLLSLALISPEVKKALIIFFTLLAVILFSLIFAKFLKMVTARWWRKALTDEKNDQVWQEVDKQTLHDRTLDESTKALMFCSSNSIMVIPLMVWLVIPIVIIGNIGLFLSGHFYIAGTVSVDVDILGEMVADMSNFREFSVIDAMIDLWIVGAYKTAVLICLFSVMWLDVKQIMVLFLWVLPPTMVSVWRRREVFQWLDVLGKLSALDIFVVVITLVSFWISFSPLATGFLSVDFLSVQVMFIPLWGFCANLIAQILSQISSHVVIHYHRKIAAWEVTGTKTASNVLRNLQQYNKARAIAFPPQSLHRHVFAIMDGGTQEEQTKEIPCCVNVVLVMFLIASACLLVLGCVCYAFQTTISGILSVMLYAGGASGAMMEHSVLSMVVLIMDQSNYVNTTGSYIGLGLFCGIFILTVLIVPLSQILILLIHWFAAMTTQYQKRLSLVMEILKSWQYCGVFLLSIFVSMIQMAKVSSLMFNNQCQSSRVASSTIDVLQSFGAVDDDTQCFYLQPAMREGLFMLLGASVALLITTVFVADLGEAAMKQRIEEERRWEQQYENANNRSMEPVDVVDTPIVVLDDSEKQNRSSRSMVDTSNVMVPVHPSESSSFSWVLSKTNRSLNAPSLSSRGGSQEIEMNGMNVTLY
eukprot:CAMPEP_0172519110 /NCGR_PEP_ID=MMETSP1066-20121228/291219_1 /TAXON_ID=671091 /ORGANISM="Coscinodiscus wailesii, Strain CCMP2513" /LENGTH=895 /DNA_ID=CAMNT_0013301631 /DNA_START=1245 /DNA_END=3932 /DNA_ORIENTATION=+